MHAPLRRPTPPSAIPDDALVARVLVGDMAAFEVIMRRHNQRLFRLARSVLRNPSDAEEAVQEAYLHAYEKLSAYRGPGAFGAWLGRIVLNKAMDRARDRGRVISLEACLMGRDGDGGKPAAYGLRPEHLASRSPDPEQLAASSDVRRLIEAAVDELPDEFRTVFILRAVEGLSVEEVARQLDVEPATVRSRDHRARRRMQERLGGALEAVLPSVFPFAGARCDRIVAAVLARIPPGPGG